MTDRNANRPGYKKTPAGWIPASWAQNVLHEVAKIQTGVAKGKTGFRQPVSMPYLRVANVQDGYVDLSEIKEITVEATELARYSLRPGDVLFTEGGDFDKLGRGCVWFGQIERCLHQNHIFAVRCDANKLLPYFLATLASSSIGRKYFALSSKQSTNLASINSTQLQIFPVSLPPLPEQRQIAAILSTWDTAIDQTRALLAAAQRRKKALMQQLLTGKRRLPGFKGKWKVHPFVDLCTEREETNRPDLPLLAITSTRGILPTADLDRKDASNEDKSAYRRICPGDIGYNTMRMWQGVSAVSSLEGIVSPAYTICIPRPGVCVEFIGRLLKFQPVVHLLWRHSQGLVDDTLSLKYHHFAKIKVSIPDEPEQRAIAAVLTTADDEIKTLEGKAAALEQQKKGLMQKLLTGEIRVKLLT